MAIREQVQNKDAQSYLKQVMEATGRDPTALARMARLNPSTVTGIMAEPPRTKTVRMATIEAIAAASGVPFQGDISAIHGGVSTLTRPAAGFVRDVPIHSLLSVPGRQLYHWNPTAIDYAHRPPGIALARKAFALKMPDSSMNGWRRKNELIYIDPSVDADEGDHAFVEIANILAPDAFSLYTIRRLVRETPKECVLGTWGLNPTETSMKRSEIIRAIRIIEWPELVFG